MNDTSQQLVNATRDALAARRLRTIAPDPNEIAKVATAAVLRQLATLTNTVELGEITDPGNGFTWPNAADFTLLADDVEASL